MKKLLVALVVMLMALACGPYYVDQLEDPAEAMWLSKVMVREYVSNPIRFELEHMYSQFRVRGKIRRIGVDSIRFSRGFLRQGDHLECRFTDPTELVGLSRKDNVTVVGVIESVAHPSLTSPVLHMVDCMLAK